MTLPAIDLFSRSPAQVRSCLLGIGVAMPSALQQEKLLQLALKVSCADAPQAAWLTRVFRSSGVEQRGTVLAEFVNDFYPPAKSPADRGPTTHARMQRYADEAPRLAAQASRLALVDSHTLPSDITHLLTASCTGFMAPGLDYALIESLGLKPSVRRLHIGFMGCHAAFNLLAAARDALAADPAARILICCTELCSLHQAYGWDPGKLIANALFADGAAAAVMGINTDTVVAFPELIDSSSLLLPQCADAMTWRIGDHGFEMTLSPGVPSLIRQRLRSWCEEFLASHDLKIADVTKWAIHPGGPKILDAVGAALNLPEASLAASREILASHGNMSSATILFILQKIFSQNPSGPCVAIGLGPGLMVEGLLLNF
jgi:predicted naringenin-chalcone synthase